MLAAKCAALVTAVLADSFTTLYKGQPGLFLPFQELGEIIKVKVSIKNEILPYATTWMDREGTALSKISQKK